MKRIGFLSFGHWQAAPWSRTTTAADAHRQTIELAEAAEALGLDGAFVRVHHFARQLASPFPLLAAIGARTSRIEIQDFSPVFVRSILHPFNYVPEAPRSHPPTAALEQRP